MTEPKKILVIQLRRIGDVLLTTPVVRALRSAFPKAQIDFLAEPPCDQVLRGNPHLTNVIVYDPKSPLRMLGAVRRDRYDWVIDFLGNPRTALLTALSGAPVRAGSSRVFHRWGYNRTWQHPRQTLYAGNEKIYLVKQLGISLVEDGMPQLAISPASKQFAETFLRGLDGMGGGPLITVSPTSRRHFNRWFLDRYAALADWLVREYQARVLLVWGPGERPVVEEVARLMKTQAIICQETPTLLDLAAVLERADLHIGNDNGTKHIATAVGAATFTVFGPHNTASWSYPDPARHLFIQKDCLCLNNNRRKHSCRELQCLDLVSLSEVQAQLTPFLNDIGKRVPH